MSTFSQRHGFAPSDAPITIRDDAPGWLRDFIVTSAQEVHIGPSDLRDMLCSLLLEAELVVGLAGSVATYLINKVANTDPQ